MKQYFNKLIIKKLCLFFAFFSTPLLSPKRTIKVIKNKHLSVARFGDGELMWMAGGNDCEMEKACEKISNDLKRTIKNKQILFV